MSSLRGFESDEVASFFPLLLKRVKTKISINCSISIYLANNLEQKQKLLGFLVKRKRVRAFKEEKKSTL